LKLGITHDRNARMQCNFSQCVAYLARAPKSVAVYKYISLIFLYSSSSHYSPFFTLDSLIFYFIHPLRTIHLFTLDLLFFFLFLLFLFLFLYKYIEPTVQYESVFSKNQLPPFHFTVAPTSLMKMSLDTPRLVKENEEVNGTYSK
jgi:hypothetical protein